MQIKTVISLFAALPAVALAATIRQQGYFSASCQEILINGRTLNASCLTELDSQNNAVRLSNSIDLNLCLGIDQGSGMLAWVPL